MSSVPRQLALALDHAESYARDDFLPDRATRTLGLIDGWPDWPANAVALVGPEGSGKTHVATIWAAIAGARVISAHALSETSLRPSLATGALVIEDAAVTSDEHALFHLINLAREEGAYLLFTARLAPSAWPVTIPDVNSRLRAMPAVTLQAPDDAMLRAVIVKLPPIANLALMKAWCATSSTGIERRSAAGAVIAPSTTRRLPRRLPDSGAAARCSGTA